MTYLDRDEIKSQLENQFAEIRKNIREGIFNENDAENIIFTECDVCDHVEPNSANYQFAREMQQDFINYEIR